MEKKKMRIWQIIVLVVILIVTILAVIWGRKLIILNKLQDKMEEYLNSTNLYYLENSNNPNLDINSYELYKQGNKEKIVKVNSSTNDIITQYVTEEYINTYWDLASGEKKRQVEINDYLSIPTITKYLNSKNALEQLINSINSTIKTEEIDGKEYYSITNLTYSGIYTVSENVEKIVLYFEKDTGLMTRKIEITENGGEYLTTFIYKFDLITQEDLQEPDATKYDLKN